jgi:hypothetical protein
MAAISFVFTIARVAEMLGEDEDLLHEICGEMEPEDGHIWVVGLGGDETPAFTSDGVENLKDLVAMHKEMK